MRITSIIGAAVSAALVLVAVTGLLFVSTTHAGSKEAVCEGIGLTGGTSDCTPSAGEPDVAKTISQVINIISVIVGIAAVIMIMIGGFKYVISAGDANNITSAKNTILYALIGLVVALLAQVIVRFVINKI